MTTSGSDDGWDGDKDKIKAKDRGDVNNDVTLSCFKPMWTKCIPPKWNACLGRNGIKQNFSW